MTKHKDGSYVAFDLSDESKAEVDHFITTVLKLSNPIDPEYLHSTIIYSHTPVPQSEYLDRKTSAIGYAIRYEIFTTKTNKKCLTAIINCPRAHDLNNMLTKLGATSSFTPYLPHITLSYDFEGSIDNLPLIPFQLYYSDLIVKPLDKDFIPPSKSTS